MATRDKVLFWLLACPMRALLLPRALAALSKLDHLEELMKKSTVSIKLDQASKQDLRYHFKLLITTQEAGIQ